MSNRWTGNYDAALAITTTALDRLLAAQHAAGSYFHGKWLPLPFGGGDDDDRVRGTLGLSLAPPRVGEVRDGAERIEFACELRGYLIRHPESPPAPETIHGTLRVSAPFNWHSDGREALLDVSLRDVRTEVSFEPAEGSGLGRRHRRLVEGEALRLLRRNVRSVNQRFRLPRRLGVAGWTPRLWSADGGRPAGLGLLVDFEAGNGGVDHDRDDLLAADNFLDDGEVVLALGRELISAVVRRAGAEALSGFSFTHTVPTTLHDFTFTATLDPDSVAAELEDGGVRVSVAGRVSGAVDLAVSAAQSFALALEDGEVRVEPSGRASLELRHRLVPDWILNRFERAVEGNLAAPVADLARLAEPALQRTLEAAPSLLADLDLSDVGGVELLPRALRVDGDAVRVAADLALAEPPAPVVRFTAGWRRSDDEGLEMELRAQPSWIPGGTIRRYRWSVLQGPDRRVNLFPESHSFVRRVPVLRGGLFPLWPPVAWCLRIDGDQVNPAPGGKPRAVSASSLCAPPLPTGDPLPAGAGLWVDVLGSRRDASGADESRVVGRAVVDLRPGTSYGVPVVIHVADPDLKPDAVEDLLAALDKAVRAAEVPAMAALVLGDDQAPPQPGRPTPVAIARDPRGAWAKARRVDVGTTLLLSPQGEVAGRVKGEPEIEALARALRATADRAPLKGRRPAAWGVATAKVREGEPAPPLTVPRFGRWIPLHKLRGEPVALCFWTPRSEASVEALSVLVDAEADGGPLVVPVHPEQDDEAAEEALKKRRLEQPSVPDRGTVAGTYGVRVWPTTVHVDRHGRVARVRYGHYPPQ